MRSLAPLAAILFANGVMTVAQVSISSIYLPISVTFDEQITGLGILTSLFFIGFGIIEVPGGALSARVGPKKVALAGIAIVSLGVLGTAYAPTFDALIVLRFMVGFGLGLFFPSMVVLTVWSMGRGSSGMGVALVTVASSVGAGLGVFGWSVLAALYGWRASLLLDAAISAAVALMVFFMVPADKASSGPKVSVAGLRRILASRRLVALSLALLGLGATGVLSGSFMVYYLEKAFDLQPGYAGLISGLGYISTIFTSLLVGKLYDRGTNAGFLIFGATAALGLGTAILAVHSLYAAIAGALICGLAGGPAGTGSIAAARKLAPSPEMEALTISIADNFSLLGVFVGALYFPFLVLGLGYPSAWVLGGIVCVVLTAPVLFFKDL
jgi:predicted MFS family arabinose efflux permease